MNKGLRLTLLLAISCFLAIRSLIVIVDAASAMAPVAITTIGMDTGPSNSDGITSDSTLLITGTATANYTITVYLDGTAITTDTQSSGGGIWIFDYTSQSLADGNYVLTATERLTDTESTPSAPFSVTVDSMPPASFTIAPTDAVVNALEATDFGFVLSTAEVGATYTYTITSSGGGGSITDAGSIASANQSFTNLDISGLNDGDITITMVLEDLAGNTTPSFDSNTTLDATLPSAFTITSLDTLVNALEATDFGFTLTTAEVGATYTYTITSSGGGVSVTDAGSIASANQAFTNLDVSGLNDGDITITMVLEDLAGNTTPSFDSNTTLDATPPAGFTIAPLDMLVNALEATDFGFTITTAEVDATYTYTITSSGGGSPITDVGSIASANQSFTNLDIFGLNNGNVTITMVLKDEAGNMTPSSNTMALLDRTAPQVQSSEVAENPSNSATTINFVVQFTEVVLNVSLDDFVLVTTGSTQATLTQVNGTGSTYTVTLANVIGIGDVTVNVLSSDITDEAGNTLIEFVDGTPHQTNISFRMFIPLITNRYNPLSNGGFEAGLDAWETSGALMANSATALDIDGILGDIVRVPLVGNQSALLGDPNYNNSGGVPTGYAELRREITLPLDATNLSLQYLLVTHDGLYSQSQNKYYDSFEVYINEVNDNQRDEICRNGATWNKSNGLAFCSGNIGAVSGATKLPVLVDGTIALDVSHLRGQNIVLIIRIYNRVDGYFNTWGYVDNVQIQSSSQ